MEQISNYFGILDEIYKELLDCDNPKIIWEKRKKKLSPWPSFILSAFQPNIEKEIQNELISRAGKIGELLILDFASNSDLRSSEANMDILIESNKQLVFSGNIDSKEIAKGIIESMVVGIEALGDNSNPLTQKIIDYLCEIVDINLGTYPKRRLPKKSLIKKDFEEYSDLLNGVLYSAVFGFYKRVKVGDLLKKHEEIIKSINCPVISIGSRKGGTGKTLFTVAIIKWLRNIRKDIRICLIDLDLSGPVWQYSLFPQRNEPSAFIDDILAMNQSVDNFIFPYEKLEDDEILNLVQEGKCNFFDGGSIGHLGVHDIPSINRTLDIAVELNSGSFYPFLARLLSAISKQYDFIIIDNSPGFHSVPYSTLGIACSVDKGRSFILSTPSHADLCGTFLELSEFRLTNIKNAPIWVINKATEESNQFAKKKRTALEVAKDLQAFDGALPTCPILEKVLEPTPMENLWNSIMMDQTVSDFGYINRIGKPMFHELSNTKYYTDVVEILDKRIPSEWLNIRKEN